LVSGRPRRPREHARHALLAEPMRLFSCSSSFKSVRSRLCASRERERVRRLAGGGLSRLGRWCRRDHAEHRERTSQARRRLWPIRLPGGQNPVGVAAARGSGTHGSASCATLGLESEFRWD
jgi:hypothetical protein